MAEKYCSVTSGGSVAEWLAGSRAWVQSAAVKLSGNCTRQTVHTRRASVHQAAKLVAALLRVAEVTAGLAESNGNLPPGLWLTSTAVWLPRTGISSGTLRSVIEYGLPLPYTILSTQYIKFLTPVREIQFRSGYWACGCSESRTAYRMAAETGVELACELWTWAVRRVLKPAACSDWRDVQRLTVIHCCKDFRQPQIAIPHWPTREPIYLPHGDHCRQPPVAHKRNAHPATEGPSVVAPLGPVILGHRGLPDSAEHSQSSHD